MKEKYTISDVATMTALSARTIRSYLKSGLLCGQMEAGKWVFTEDEIEAFFANRQVRTAVQTRKTAAVRDFLADTHKRAEKMCMMWDFPVGSAEADAITARFVQGVQEAGGGLTFSADRVGSVMRVILTGPPEAVLSCIARCRVKEI